MKRFLVVYSGPPTPPDASHAGWREWFQGLGDALVDTGSPMTNGIAVRPDSSTSEETLRLNGYSLIQAEDRDAAVELVRPHPLLAHGDYSIEVFEVPSK
jgi:hypothetical protein